MTATPDRKHGSWQPERAAAEAIGVKIAPDDEAAYPPSLYHLDQPPELAVSGPLERGRRVVAIVGSRSARDGALGFTHQLAYHLAKANVIVVSGGAKGVDAMAHRGALAAGGTTWCVACTGRGQVFPRQNKTLFETIEQSSSSRMIWPLPDGTPIDKETPRFRNGVLVGLAECVVVIQAAQRSGSRNAATWSRELGRRLFWVVGSPWDTAFDGTNQELARGAGEPIWSVEHLFSKLELPAPEMDDPAAVWGGIKPLHAPPRPRRTQKQTYSEPPLFSVDKSTWSEDEKSVFSNLSMAPIQQDTIIDLVGLPTSSTLTALLTLSLKDVVVEGPDGFFRRRIAL